MGEITRKHIPMFRYAVFLLIGIALSRYCALPILFIAGIAIGCTGLIIFRLLKPNRTYKIELFLFISIVMLCLGILRFQVWQQTASPHIKRLRISSFPQKQSFQTQFEATIITESLLDLFDAETFLVLCKDTSIQVHYGEVFVTSKAPSEIETATLPFEFDYKNYLFSNGIRNKLELCSINKDSTRNVSNIFYTWIEASRVQFKKSTAQIFSTPTSKGLAESLLLGYREELDRDTKDAFLKSGVSHLLAVSGMHTALLYEALFIVFIPFGNTQKKRVVFLFFALGMLSYFTFLSGCSTSVVRASIMCGLFAIAYAFRKRGTGLNTLGSSMLLILWFSPYQLWNLGFQLSVLAVIGILTLHQFISKQFNFKTKFFTYAFDALSITICAQITTLPVILFHFQSFPLYFIPANLILIPISTIGLFASMISIFFVGLEIPFTWLFICTQWIIELFSTCAAFFAQLPNSSIQPIAFTAIEAWVLVSIVFFYIQYPFTLSKRNIYVGFLICIAWSGYRIQNEYKSEQKSETIFVRNGKRSALLSIKGLGATMYTQIESKPRDQASLKAYYNLNYIEEFTNKPLSSGLIARTSDENIVWLTKRNCTPISVPIRHVFSYKEKDSITYSSSLFHSLKVKRLVSIQ